MKKIIEIAIFVLLAMVFTIGCGGSSGGNDSPDFKGEDLSLTKDGVFEYKNIIRQLPAEAKMAAYFYSDDTGWCAPIEFEVRNGKMKLNFKDIEGIEPGVIRFMLKWFIPGQGYGNFNLDQLPNSDKKMFVRETHSSSTYGSGDLVLAVLYQNGIFSPVPRSGQSYGRDTVNWIVESRNHEKSDCLGGGGGDDSAPNPRDVDNDGDGYTENEGDCNDNNANVYPGAYDIPDDGIDQDCDGQDATDQPNPKDVDNDGDGYTENEGDCNDNDATIYPGATEICGDGVDQDCNGRDLACEPTPPVEEDCVSASINGTTLNFGNIYAGFQVPYGKTGKIVAVSEKTGWQYEEGISVSVSGGNGSVNLSKLMFSSGATRFNLIMRVDGVDYWFISDLLCDDARTMLQHQTDAPEAPWADNDVVMSLENVSQPFTSWEVGYRG